MPCRTAARFTASSRASDRRRLTALSFRRSSKRTGTIWEKSYSVRPASATKRSASSSVRRASQGFFMPLPFLHAGGEAAQERLHEGQAALPVQELRAELHRYA